MEKGERRENMKLKGGIIIIAIILALLALASLCLKCFGVTYADIIGTIATISSVILSTVSLIYTYASGAQTLSMLNDINERYGAFVSAINENLIQANYDEENLKNVRDIVNELHTKNL